MGVPGRAGRRPKPTRLKVLTGSRRVRRDGREPVPPSGVPPRPPDLDEVGQAEWDRLIPALARLGLLTQIDWTLPWLYCDTYSECVRMRWALAQAAGGGFVVRAPDGSVKANPLYIQYLKAKHQLRLLLGEMGLTPASRARLVAASPVEAEDDPFAEFEVIAGGKT
jgi:P27 family predicted phage terminase small subunit